MTCNLTHLTILQFESISIDQLPSEIRNAQKFTSVCINPAVYLPWLMSQCLKNGVIFKRAVLKSLSDATNFHHSMQKADLLVNCTGLSSKLLEGVRDSQLYPARGQTVIVRNDPGIMFAASGTDDGEDELVYMMTRAAGKPLEAKKLAERTS